MSRITAIGVQSFEKLRNNNYFYVDKTDFIREWWNSGEDVSLITRPRRFGKTLTLDMIETFFSAAYAGRGDLFEGLDIWKEQKFRELQGTFPVIRLNLADADCENYEDTISKINHIMKRVYLKYSFLKQDPLLSPSDLDLFMDSYKMLNESSSEMALSDLSIILEHYYGKKPIILMDEYDVPLQAAWLNGFWDKLSRFMRAMFRAAFKNNTSLGRGLLTGVTRVGKENIFSGLNNLRVYTVTSKKYSSSFGFTEEEVQKSLQEYHLADKFPDVKRWYDGFQFGNTAHIYNPWSITSFLEDQELKAYWVNTSSNDLIEKLVREGDKEIKTAFEDLLLGRSITSTVSEDVTYLQLNGSLRSVCSLLLASGYLTIEGFDLSSKKYTLRLTNYEVYEMIQEMVNRWFVENTEKAYNEFLEALLSRNVQKLNCSLRKLLLETISYFDTGKGSVSESFYHGLVLGLVIDLKDRYLITSNRESGKGRYDVMLIPRQNLSEAIILEFKAADSDTNEVLSETVHTALAQINEKKYDTELVTRGFSKKQIIHYGFAFSRKQVLVGIEDSDGITMGDCQLFAN